MSIDLIPTDTLIAELKRRYPLLIVAGSADLSKDCRAEVMFYQGTILSLIGLTDVVYEDLLDQYYDRSEEAQDIP